ncbi:Septin 4, variant 5 [Dermatophagoides farinae]|uniref:Septin 4, variant 5 n=1 Tax=Dermatophagoides farinae TaxID=6954 RepID=A0A922HWN0_DERFA|nr:Septin 4, variant 5 [Dermatophagoides farinae]
MQKNGITTTASAAASTTGDYTSGAYTASTRRYTDGRKLQQQQYNSDRINIIVIIYKEYVGFKFMKMK